MGSFLHYCQHIGAHEAQSVQEALDLGAGGVVEIPAGDWPVSALQVHAGTTLLMWGARLIRERSDGEPVLTLAEDCVVYGGLVDGAGVSGSAKREAGVFVEGSGCRLEAVKATGNHSDGFRVEGDGSRLNDCDAYRNGFQPGPTGTGDGFYVLNASDVALRGCRAGENARSGFSVTTWNGSAVERGLSRRVWLEGCWAEGNGYNDINMESVTEPRVSGVVAGSLVSSFSEGGVFRDVDGSVYCQDHERCTVERMRGGSLFISGVEARVVGAELRDAVGAWAVEVATERGVLSDVSVFGGQGGVNARGIESGFGFQVVGASGVGFRLNLENVVSPAYIVDGVVF